MFELRDVYPVYSAHVCRQSVPLAPATNTVRIIDVMIRLK